MDAAALIAQGVFENNGESIYVAMLKALKRGNAQVFSALADRAYGKPPHQVAVSSTDSESPLSFNMRVEYVSARTADLLEAPQIMERKP